MKKQFLLSTILLTGLFSALESMQSAPAADASFTVLANTTVTTKQSLGNGQTGTVNAPGGKLQVTSGTVVTIDGSSTLPANKITITNNGTITSGTGSGGGRVIRDQSGGSNSLITNNAGALIQGAGNDVIALNVASGTTSNSVMDIENYGTIQSTNSGGNGSTTTPTAKGNQAINMTVALGSTTVNNYSTGVIWSTAADGVRPGINGVVNNDGLIFSNQWNDPVNGPTSSDGVDAQNNSGLTIVNGATTTAVGGHIATYQGALTGYVGNSSDVAGKTQSTIEGGRHGITGGDTGTLNTVVQTGAQYGGFTGAGTYSMTITNNQGATIQGDNGSGINIDGFGIGTQGSAFITNEHVTVTNYGKITGNGVTGDGDGIDVDGTVTVDNFGTIVSKNSFGTSLEYSEGITVGGGGITNEVGATIEGQVANGNTSAVGRGITLAGIDHDANDTDFAIESIYTNTTVTNSGLIKGDSDSGIVVLGTTGGGYSVTITNNATGTIEGSNTGMNEDTGNTGFGQSKNQGAIELDDTGNTYSITNYGTIKQDSTGTGKAVSMHSATSNVLNIYGGSASVIGDISGDTAADSTLTINPGNGNSFSYGYVVSNFSVDINSDSTNGKVTLSGVNTYSGNTTLSGGTLVLANNSAIGTGMLITVDPPVNPTVLYNNDITISNQIQLQGNTNVEVDNTDSATQSGAISESGGSYSLTKVGTGTLLLTSSNSYSGGTVVSTGTLTVGNTSAFGTGNITQNGGTINFGNSVRQLNVGGTFNQTAGTLVFTLNNSGNDKIAITGAGTSNFSGTATVDFTGFTPAPIPMGHTTNTEKFTLVTTANGYTQSLTFNPENLTSPTSTAALDFATAPDDIVLYVTTTGSGTFTLTGLTSNQTNTGNYINNALFTGKTNPLIMALGNIVAVNPGALGGYLDQLTALNFGRFTSSSAFNNTSFTTQQFDNYLANHRGSDGTFVGSNGGIDDSGLVYNDPNVIAGLQSVHSRLLAWNPAQSSGLLSDVPQLSLGGMDMKSSIGNSPKTNPWNVFVSGNVVLSQDFSDPSAGLAHTDATTGGVQVGFDYAINKNFLVGAMFGYGHTDATLDTLNSKAQVDTYSPTVYASYADSGWYSNGLISYGFSDYDQKRNVSIGGFGGTAHSSPSGDQIVGNLDGGYDFHHKGWTYGPTLGLQYVHLDVDGYTETGLPGANLTVNSNEADSLRSRLGGRVSYAWQTEGLVFTPHLDVSWQHEFLDQSRGITSQFDGLGAGSFSIQTASPSRDSALVDVGLDTQVDKTIDVFADYSVQAGQDNYFGQSVQAGVKIGF